MALRGRLGTLEADTAAARLKAWSAAWERNHATFERHMRAVDVDAISTHQPHLSEADLERAYRAFLESLGVRQFGVFAAWFGSYELPDLDAARPDLNMWPADVPEPPDELPGEWDRVLPYATSEDVIERLGAQLYLFVLASARTARETPR